MKSLKKIVIKAWDKVFVFFGVSLVLLPISPLNMRGINRDSGVFLYMGWRILNGELPYLDVWDHKPPIIFYLNALGLAIMDNSRWGVWLLEFLFLFLAAFIGFKIIQKAFGTFPAIFSTLLWLLTLLFVIQGGNLTTEYTLPLQFTALMFAQITFEKQNISVWRWLLIGAIGAIAFFTKQTAIGIWISIIMFLFIYRLKSHRLKELFFEFLSFLIGLFLVFLFWILFFIIRGGGAEFWSSAFEYNLIYSTTIVGLSARLRPILFGIFPLTKVGLFQFAGIGYMIGLLLIFYKRDIPRNWIPLIVIGLFDLPIELILISVSGKTYAHYYMTILPVLALFSAIPIWVIYKSKLLDNIPNIIKNTLNVCIIILFFWTSLRLYKSRINSWRHMDTDQAIVSYIKLNTTKEDYVLLWGAETKINFLSQRMSPTRFVYQNPIYNQEYVNEQMIVEFLNDIIQNNPKFIIAKESMSLYEFPINSYDIQKRVTFLRCHYEIVHTIDNWSIYEYKTNENKP